MSNAPSITGRKITTLLVFILAFAAQSVPVLAENAVEPIGEEKLNVETSESSESPSLSDETPLSRSQELAVDSSDLELSAQSTVVSGTIGSCTWSIDDAGTLRIDAVPGSSGSMGPYPYIELPYYQYGDRVRSVIVGEGVTSCLGYAFFIMPNLESVSLPTSLVSFGGYDASSDTTWGGGYVLYGTKVTSITIPANVQYVFSSGFPDAEAWPAGYPFAVASSLKSVAFAEGMRTIPANICNGGVYLFDSNHRFIPISEWIKDYPDCDSYHHYHEWLAHPLSLEEVTIPASVTSIAENAFHECGHIKKINYGGSPSEWKRVSIAEGNEGLVSATINYERQDPKPFPDVAAGAWYEGVVSRAVGLGLLSGYKNGNFGPDDNITRGQVAVVLWKMAGQQGAGAGARDFPDVRADDYFRDAVRWASGAGVVNGYADGRFGPNDNVTREQLAAMLANYARNVARRQVAGSVDDCAGMEDKAEVSDWAREAVGWCFGNGIITGAGTYIQPRGNATRAQAAKMVVVLHDQIG